MGRISSEDIQVLEEQLKKYKRILLDTNIRAAYGIKTPDSIFLATAFEEGVEAFITNDLQLRRVEGIDYIILDDYFR